MSQLLHVRLVDEDTFWREYHARGGIYFIKDVQRDTVKIGYTRDPLKRLSNLQVGNSAELLFMGLVAADHAIERHIHQQFPDGHIRGEWFHERGVIRQWLCDLTSGSLFAGSVWTLTTARQVFWSWNAETGEHCKHVFNDVSGAWEPPLP